MTQDQKPMPREIFLSDDIMHEGYWASCDKSDEFCTHYIRADLAEAECQELVEQLEIINRDMEEIINGKFEADKEFCLAVIVNNKQALAQYRARKEK